MGGEAKQTCIIVPEKARRGWPPDDAALGCFGAVACRSRLSCLFLISAAVSRAISSSHSVAPQLASPSWGILPIRVQLFLSMAQCASSQCLYNNH
jgi:hypothetical protein